MIYIEDDDLITVARALYFYHDMYTNQDEEFTDEAVLASIVRIRKKLGREIKQRGFLDGQL